MQQSHFKKTFDDIVFTGKSAPKREFEQCIFKNCNFSESDFAESTFTDCTFIGCNLATMKIRGAGMKNVIFKNSKLTGVDFSQCADFLFSVSFESCMLNYAAFSNRKMQKTVFVKCSLKDVDFMATELSNAVFDECDMLGAQFEKTNLSGADFTSSFNYALDPEKNTLKGAKFSFDGLPGLLLKYEIEIM
ncbi:MAG TPA: pentapeptide repeat-containing protein [Patescibacteria group bacterium]|nr:pentapeptide repeat-containing protein [Patescibacteria group bacterium]